MAAAAAAVELKPLKTIYLTQHLPCTRVLLIKSVPCKLNARERLHKDGCHVRDKPLKADDWELLPRGKANLDHLRETIIPYAWHECHLMGQPYVTHDNAPGSLESFKYFMKDAKNRFHSLGASDCTLESFDTTLDWKGSFDENAPLTIDVYDDAPRVRVQPLIVFCNTNTLRNVMNQLTGSTKLFWAPAGAGVTCFDIMKHVSTGPEYVFYAFGEQGLCGNSPLRHPPWANAMKDAHLIDKVSRSATTAKTASSDKDDKNEYKGADLQKQQGSFGLQRPQSLVTPAKALKVQVFLRKATAAKKSPEDALLALHTKYAIKICISPDKALVILNYEMTKSPKFHAITRECRQLILEIGTWDVVAKSFTRFYSHGKHAEHKRLDEAKVVTFTTKEDGSLICLFNYKGVWRISTMASFADGHFNNSDKCWTDVFFSLINRDHLSALDPNRSYICELCTRYNIVVREYAKDRVFLLASFDKRDLSEADDLSAFADVLGVDVVSKHTFASADAVKAFLKTKSKTDPTFEGMVMSARVPGCGVLRAKIKSLVYNSIHLIGSNTTRLELPKYHVPIIHAGEISEMMLNETLHKYEPFLLKRQEDMLKLRAELESAFNKAQVAQARASSKKKKKAFALAVQQVPEPLKCYISILFKAQHVGFDEAWNSDKARACLIANF